MDQFIIKKEVVQAILIADDNAENFSPVSDCESVALLPLVNTPLIDYALDALNRNGIEEVFIFASRHLQKLKDHIKQSIITYSSWTNNMTVQVIGGEGCRCFGDAMRELDSKGLIREHFVLLSANTITNADLKFILEQHKQTCKYDKGAVATFIFKEINTQQRTGNELMIAMDFQNKRLHYHRRLDVKKRENDFEIPLEVFMNNSHVMLLHNIVDSGIAIGSPAMLSLFSDNFDFETCDDFIKGVLINEEILDSRLYVTLLPREQYARKVNNWLAYQIVTHDVMNRWVYPLVPDMGVTSLQQQYTLLKNHIYKSPNANLAKVALRENVVVQGSTSVGQGSCLRDTVIGKNVSIGQNCRLNNAFILDNVTIGDNCALEFCVVGRGTKIGDNCQLLKGTIIDYNCLIPNNTTLSQSLIAAAVPQCKKDGDDNISKLSDKAFILTTEIGNSKCTNEDEADDMKDSSIMLPDKLPICQEDSDYSSSSDEDIESRACSPVQDDANIFFSEVMDSLTRGLQEKSNPDFLILEINSSRHAYNISLNEVNFNVVKALFSLKPIKEPANNILTAVNMVLKQLGTVMLNYIKTEDAMMDCLKALEDIYEENEFIKQKFSQIIHYLYDKDFLTEDVILEWYHQRMDKEDQSIMRQSLLKLIEWLEQSSEEEDDDDD